MEGRQLGEIFRDLGKLADYVAPPNVQVSVKNCGRVVIKNLWDGEFNVMLIWRMTFRVVLGTSLCMHIGDSLVDVRKGCEWFILKYRKGVQW